MNRKIKALCLAFAAAAVMCMAAASVARASELHLFEINTMNITGEQTVQNSFVTDSGSAKCSQATFEGTLVESGEIDELTLTGTYAGCTTFGLAGSIDMNGCRYTMTGAEQPANIAQVDVTGCTAGKVIEITNAVCTMTIPEQHGRGHIKFEDAIGGTHVKAEITTQEITYEAHGLCPNLQGANQTVLTHNGQYNGQATVKAFSDGGSELVTFHKHQYDKLRCGGQMGLLTT